MHLLRNRIPPVPLLLSAAQSPADIAQQQHQQRQHFEPWMLNFSFLCKDLFRSKRPKAAGIALYKEYALAVYTKQNANALAECKHIKQ